jgi:hypothetical protein
MTRATAALTPTSNGKAVAIREDVMHIIEVVMVDS